MGFLDDDDYMVMQMMEDEDEYGRKDHSGGSGQAPTGCLPYVIALLCLLCCIGKLLG